MRRLGASSESDSDGTDIDISPLIDCIFILLLFFIVTTSFVRETGIDVDRPQAASSQQLERNSLLFAVTSDGAVVYGGEEIGIGGVRPIVKRNLQKEDIPVVIQCDKATAAWLLVRVIDEAKLGGAERVSLATRKGDSD